MSVPRMTLADGIKIPQLGFGTWQVPPADTARVVDEAYRAGYRHIDTAQMYQNEAGVGEALRASGLGRDEVFITTKCNNGNHGFDGAIAALETSLGLLDLDYVDLYLIHWLQPLRDQYVDTWRGFIELKRRGLTRQRAVADSRKLGIAIESWSPLASGERSSGTAQ
jgi:2,5-diketo-D-gluconate reductase A